MLRTNLTLSKRIFSDSGSRFVDTYRPVINADGHMDLIQSGKKDVYADIQSHAEECDINLLIEKYQMTGDPAVINKREGLYLDVTDMPKTYAEIYERVAQAQDVFSKLPLSVKEKFDFDPAKFFASLGSKETSALLAETFNASPASDAGDASSSLSSNEAATPTLSVEGD
ncbi:minor capsid protein [Capybara microvirus Cap1_SP_143]|nr:minor capsid protein [Capybara microvirus Cap1_SP_143]